MDVRTRIPAMTVSWMWMNLGHAGANAVPRWTKDVQYSRKRKLFGWVRTKILAMTVFDVDVPTLSIT